MKKEIITDIEKLSTRAKEFDVLRNNQKDAIKITQDLSDTLESCDRLYLTANQIGAEERAFAIKFKDEIDIFMNPAYQRKDKMILYREKDPLTDKEYIIPRFTEISLVFQDCLGQTKGFKFNEAASIIINQAMDALNGILVSDYGLEVDELFDSAPEDEKSEVLAAYVDALNSAYNNLDKELSDDSEFGTVWQHAKFVKNYAEGHIKTEEKPLSNRKKKKLKKLEKLAKAFGRRVH